MPWLDGILTMPSSYALTFLGFTNVSVFNWIKIVNFTEIAKEMNT